MALYHEAASILDAASKEDSGSLKSIVFGKKTWKSDQKTLFALTSESAKWSAVLSEVVENSGILKVERTLTPTLTLVLAHDLLLAKRGIALPAKHGLVLSISRHKVRLASELTKSRIRRRFATLNDLRESINNPKDKVENEDGEQPKPRVRHPRWVRVNTLRTTLEQQMKTTFSAYNQVKSIEEAANSREKVFYIDEHIPNLVAIPPGADIMRSKAYREGEVILQDKASCFPAYLLDPQPEEGLVIDACAAPGNKTTHVAAILNERHKEEDEMDGVIACEKNPARSETLAKMVKIAGGDEIITIKAKQDFTKIYPDAPSSDNVTALLLDPSCSGSGIMGRDEVKIDVHLPNASASDSQSAGKKRKRGSKPKPVEEPLPPVEEEEEPLPVEDDAAKLQARLTNLSSFQLRIVEHAMAFPAAKRITYSTCSIHPEENEHVVIKALSSAVAKERGWRVMKREDQVEGMKKWHIRGWVDAAKNAEGISDIEDDAQTIADACIRCNKGSEDGTMGFFVAGFVRDPTVPFPERPKKIGKKSNKKQQDQEQEDEHKKDKSDEDDEWNGFGDD